MNPAFDSVFSVMQPFLHSVADVQIRTHSKSEEGQVNMRSVSVFPPRLGSQSGPIATIWHGFGSEPLIKRPQQGMRIVPDEPRLEPDCLCILPTEAHPVGHGLAPICTTRVRAPHPPNTTEAHPVGHGLRPELPPVQQWAHPVDLGFGSEPLCLSSPPLSRLQPHAGNTIQGQDAHLVGHGLRPGLPPLQQWAHPVDPGFGSEPIRPSSLSLSRPQPHAGITVQGQEAHQVLPRDQHRQSQETHTDANLEVPSESRSHAREVLGLGFGPNCGKALPFLFGCRYSHDVRRKGDHEDLGLGSDDRDPYQSVMVSSITLPPPSLSTVSSRCNPVDKLHLVHKILDFRGEPAHDFPPALQRSEATLHDSLSPPLDFGFGSHECEGNKMSRHALSGSVSHPGSHQQDHPRDVLPQYAGFSKPSREVAEMNPVDLGIGSSKGVLVSEVGMGSSNAPGAEEAHGESMVKHEAERSGALPCLSPLNPRLPWPRYEPRQPASSVSHEGFLPPTQKFQVVLPCNKPADESAKKIWMPGGLNGGAPKWHLHQPHFQIGDATPPKGWWLHVYGSSWSQISLPAVQGRTIRQERESLGLGEVDTTLTTITVISAKGCFQTRWDYKFPHSATDDVVILIAPKDQDIVGSLPCFSQCSLNKNADSSVPQVSGATLSQSQASAEEPQLAPCWSWDPSKSIAQVLEEEWGASASDCFVTLHGKCISCATMTTAIPVGAPLRIRGRLRGGAPSHVKKLKELLHSKGVPEDEVNSRAAEVSASIGDAAIAEAFGCFDPWQALKSKCHGKLRIIKQSEARSSKTKKGDDEEDSLQTNDPWAEALQNRQVRPEASFFLTAANEAPVILQTVSHGCTGLAIVDLKEAELLARADADLSPDELAIITLGEPDLPDAKRPIRRIQFPCVDQKDMRMLARGTLIDLGAARMKLAGEDAILPMQVTDTVCIACEIQKGDMEEWPEFSRAPVKFLKKVLNLQGEDVLHVWGKKWFRAGKTVPSPESAECIHDASHQSIDVRCGSAYLCARPVHEPEARKR